MADVLARWKMLLTLLFNQIQAGASDAVIENTRARVRQFAKDTDQRITPLEKPHFQDPCFKGIRFGFPKGTRAALYQQGKTEDRTTRDTSYLNPVHMPDFADPEQVGKVLIELERLYINSKRRTKEYRVAISKIKQRLGRILAANATGGVYRGGGRAGDPGPCWDGCGEKVNFKRDSAWNVIGTSRFRKGHHLKYAQLVSLVERGLLERERLPNLIRDDLPWTTCKMCRGPIPAVDPYGRELKPDARIGIACWRERLHRRWPYKRPKRIVRDGVTVP
jgi:hypothetical protein